MSAGELHESVFRTVTAEYGRTTIAGDWLAAVGRSEPVPPEWLDADPETDLRPLLDPLGGGAEYSDALLRRAARALLAPGDQFALWVFLHSPDGQSWIMDRAGDTGKRAGNQDLGPLADVQIYATDPFGRYEGKSHGLCIHEKYLTAEHELLTLRDYLPVYLEDPGAGPWSVSGRCSKCAGYAIRRLDEEQFAHYWACVQAAHVDRP